MQSCITTRLPGHLLQELNVGTVVTMNDSLVGALRYRGGRTRVNTYFTEEGVFLRPPHVRDFVKEWYFLYPGTKYAGGGG